MGLKRIDERLSRVATIIKGWSGKHNVPRIERDLALEELRNIYDEILDYTPEDSDEEEHKHNHESATIAAAPEVISNVVDDFDDALDIDALLGIGVDDSAETSQSFEEQDVVEEERVESVDVPSMMPSVPEEQPEEQPETTHEENAEESIEKSIEESVEENIEEEVEEQQPKAVPNDVVEVANEDESSSNVAGALFNLDDIPIRAKRGRKMVHLYNDNFTPTISVVEPATSAEEDMDRAPINQKITTPQPAVEQSVISDDEEQPKRLGDVLGGGIQTLAEAMAADESTTPFNRIEELRKAIGLNDKFLMIRDLFGGDAERYEATIDTLDEFEDLDECMIYIVENFRWNPDLEAAKLLVSLLERKLA